MYIKLANTNLFFLKQAAGTTLADVSPIVLSTMNNEKSRKTAAVHFFE